LPFPSHVAALKLSVGGRETWSEKNRLCRLGCESG
jgi:hypothetical protein